MEADAEHQQHHANIRQLAGHGIRRHDIWQTLSHDHARQKITYEWRQTEFIGHEAQDEGENETNGDRGNQSDIMRHRIFCRARPPVCKSNASHTVIFRLTDRLGVVQSLMSTGSNINGPGGFFTRDRQ